MKKSSIIIPHYATPEHLDFCLRCIEHFTPEPHETLVVDNGSEEAMLAPLRKRTDIVLLERRQDPSLDQHAHKAALDFGIEHASGEYIIAVHTDTFVIRKGWITFLAERLESNHFVAYGPSNHRLYPPSLLDLLKSLYKSKKELKWIRPVLTIYKPEIFEKHRFMDYQDVGHLTEPYVQEGRAGFLGRKEASQWAFHAGGTTRLHHLKHRKKAKRKKEKLNRRLLSHPEIEALARGRDYSFFRRG